MEIKKANDRITKLEDGVETMRKEMEKLRTVAEKTLRNLNPQGKRQPKKLVIRDRGQKTWSSTKSLSVSKTGNLKINVTRNLLSVFIECKSKNLKRTEEEVEKWLVYKLLGDRGEQR